MSNITQARFIGCSQVYDTYKGTGLVIGHNKRDNVQEGGQNQSLMV